MKIIKLLSGRSSPAQVHPTLENSEHLAINFEKNLYHVYIKKNKNKNPIILNPDIQYVSVLLSIGVLY